VSLGGISNLDYTVLLCSKMAATREFYRDIMKFPIETDLENWVSFRVGAALLTLRPRGWSHFDDGKSVPGSAAVQLAFRVPPPAVDACHAECVPISRGPTDLPDWRHRTLFFRDPEDNIIEIYAEY
jgi:catechol 2,3-dioxygenase-like lactoylglutathione lyase family enzyme